MGGAVEGRLMSDSDRWQAACFEAFLACVEVDLNDHAAVEMLQPKVSRALQLALDHLLKDGDPFDGDDWETVQRIRRLLSQTEGRSA